MRAAGVALPPRHFSLLANTLSETKFHPLSSRVLFIYLQATPFAQRSFGAKNEWTTLSGRSAKTVVGFGGGGAGARLYKRQQGDHPCMTSSRKRGEKLLILVDKEH